MPKCVNTRCKREIPEGALFCPWCGRRQETADKKKKRIRPKGSGSVCKLKGDRRSPWVAVYRGKSIGRMFATREEAAAALAEVVEAAQPALYHYTLENVYDAWSELAYRDMSLPSRRAYEQAWAKLPPELRSKEARLVRSDDLQAVVDGMQGRGLSDSSASKVKFLYSQLCRWMMQRDLIRQNYAQFIRVQATAHREAKTFMPEEVALINRLATQGDPEDRMTQAAMLTMILIFTGFRIGELFTLRCEDVRLEGKMPCVVGGLKTDAGRNRLVPIYRRVLPFFRFFLRRARGELLISGYSGRQTANGWRANDYKTMLESLSIEYRPPHNARKTMATNAAESGMDQMAMMKIMGWTDINIGAQYYVHPDAAYLAEQMDLLDAWDEKLGEPGGGEEC